MNEDDEEDDDDGGGGEVVLTHSPEGMQGSALLFCPAHKTAQHMSIRMGFPSEPNSTPLGTL